MTKTRIVAPLLAASAMIAGFSAPAHAEGKADRARKAIAAAEAKIDTADQLGTAEFRPGETAQAKAALAHAKENLSAGHKPEAIDDAIHAQALADTAIGMMQKHQAQVADRQAAHTAAALADAQGQAVQAQSQVDAANARADMAAAAAQSSAAEAASARQAAALAVANQQPPAPTTVQTTVTTQGATKARVKKTTVKRVARRTSHSPAPQSQVRTASNSGTVTTTTTISR